MSMGCQFKGVNANYYGNSTQTILEHWLVTESWMYIHRMQITKIKCPLNKFFEKQHYSWIQSPPRNPASLEEDEEEEKRNGSWLPHHAVSCYRRPCRLVTVS